MMDNFMMKSIEALIKRMNFYLNDTATVLNYLRNFLSYVTNQLFVWKADGKCLFHNERSPSLSIFQFKICTLSMVELSTLCNVAE